MRKPPNTLSLKKFGLGNLWVKKVFGSKKFLGQKSFWVNKVFGSKKFCASKKFFGSKKFFKTKKIWVNKFLGQIFFGSTKFWGKRNIWVKNIQTQNWQNNWGHLFSTFHVGRPETLTHWKSESVTDGPTDGRTYGQTDMGRCYVEMLEHLKMKSNLWRDWKMCI